MDARKPPFHVRLELPGWELFWAHMEVSEARDAVLAARRGAVAAAAQERFGETPALAAHPTVQALRRLFREAGCDPTRYRPASEALLRRLVKGSPLPAIHPIVDLSNCLSAELHVPCCVMAEGTFGTELVLRSGGPEDGYTSLRGPFRSEGKPLLADEDGPLDTPITGNERVKVREETRSAWLVAYLPAGEVTPEEARDKLVGLARDTGVDVLVYAPSR